MAPVGRGLARTPVTPDAVTYAGLVLQAVVAVLILDGRLLVAGLVAVAAALADVFDGALARARGSSGRWGAFLDSTTDRISDALFLAPIAWLYGVQPDIPERLDLRVAALALAALVLSFLVSYARARAESLGLDCSVGFAERAERLILLIVVLVFDVVLVGVALLTVASLFTFLQRMVHVARQARAG